MRSKLDLVNVLQTSSVILPIIIATAFSTLRVGNSKCVMLKGLLVLLSYCYVVFGVCFFVTKMPLGLGL